MVYGSAWRSWILYTTIVLDFVLEYLEHLLWIACTSTHTKIILVQGVQSFLCSIIPLLSLSKKCMKLFDARLNAICTFDLRIKQFLNASNIDFSDILETLLHLVLWRVKPPEIVLDLMYLKKDDTDASIYKHYSWKYEPGTCVYRWFTGWQLCSLCYVSIRHCNSHEITRC